MGVLQFSIELINNVVFWPATAQSKDESIGVQRRPDPIVQRLHNSKIVSEIRHENFGALGHAIDVSHDVSTPLKCGETPVKE